MWKHIKQPDSNPTLHHTCCTKGCHSSKIIIGDKLMTKCMQFTHWVSFLIRKLMCWNSYVWPCPHCAHNPVNKHINLLELLKEKYSVFVLHCQKAYEAIKSTEKEKIT